MQCLSNGVKLECLWGTMPSTLTVLPESRVLVEGNPIGCISDNIPEINMASFGMCRSLANPVVLSATIQAGGILTPQPCEPIIVSTWVPFEANVMAGNKPVTTTNSCLECAYIGTISVVAPNQSSVIAG